MDSIWRAGKLGQSELGVGTMHVLAFGYSVRTSGKQIRKDHLDIFLIHMFNQSAHPTPFFLIYVSKESNMIKILTN